MPAVLVEIGYLTNPEQESALASAPFQTRVAQAITDAIARFFAAVPAAASPAPAATGGRRDDTRTETVGSGRGRAGWLREWRGCSLSGCRVGRARRRRRSRRRGRARAGRPAGRSRPAAHQGAAVLPERRRQPPAAERAGSGVRRRPPRRRRATSSRRSWRRRSRRSSRPIPSGTTLKELFLTDRGDAYVDLSAEFSTNHMGGSLDEILAVYTMVAALTENLPSRERTYRFSSTAAKWIHWRAMSICAARSDAPLNGSSSRRRQPQRPT